MAGFGIDGLVSGLDTTALINSLMQLEAAPQRALQRKVDSTQEIVSALRALNTKVASLAEAATKAAEPTSWDAYTARTSDPSVTATATSAALPASLTFTVGSLARAQVSVTAPMTDFPASVLTVVRADGTLTTIEPASTDLDDVVAAINDSDAGITATAVNIGTPDAPSYRLQLTATSTGVEHAFDVYLADAAAVQDFLDGGAPVPVLVDSSQPQVTDAADATILLWAGSSAEETFTSATNTFSEVLTGVSFTVSQTTDDPVTLTVARDDDALAALASGLVGAVGVVLSDIASRTRSSTSTGADGGTVVTPGLLSGDGAVRTLAQQLTAAVSYPVDGISPSEVGIELHRDGTVTFDQQRFAAALAEDPARVQTIISGLAARVAEVATGASDAVSGTLTQKITSHEGAVRDLGAQIHDWDRRLELRRATLQQQYAALEVALSRMQSQSAWLASQLASLGGGRALG